MNITLRENGLSAHAEMLKRKLTERISVDFVADGGLLVELWIDEEKGNECYEIERRENGYAIIGGDSLGLYYGIGKFLHSANFSDGDLTPRPPKGLQSPDCSFRAIYFSVHNYNWYHTAPQEDLVEYLEEMLLWGYNAIHCIVPVVNIVSLGDEVFCDSVARARKLYLLAKKVGLKISFGINPNQGLLGSPHEYDAEETVITWKAGRNLCPSKPGAVEHLKEIWRAKFEAFLDIGIDYIHMWPYDEGGCCCDKCWPWGARGYADLCTMVVEEGKKYYPNAEFIASTWCFDTLKKNDGDPCEYEGFYRRLSGDLDVLDYIMVDAHEDFPAYVLSHTPVKPIVNFPEISMWGLYPWGGFGANPLPRRFQRIWDSAKHVLCGGMPYSEGIYEDILKIQWAGYYWNKDASYREILAEYIRYYYETERVDEILEIMELIEDNHAALADNTPPDMEKAERALALARAVDATLSPSVRSSWRWRILFIRTILDVKRYAYFYAHKLSGANVFWNMRRRTGNYLKNDEEAQELFRELCAFYHCVDYNGQNRWTHPPVIGGDPEDTLR